MLIGIKRGQRYAEGKESEVAASKGNEVTNHDHDGRDNKDTDSDNCGNRDPAYHICRASVKSGSSKSDTIGATWITYS